MNKKIIFVISMGFFWVSSSFPMADASPQNEELCEKVGGEIKNFGDAFNHEYLDNCLNLNLEQCSEINGVWKECIPPDCSDVSKPCPSVRCIGNDVCLLIDHNLRQQEIESQEIHKQITNVIIIGSVIIAIIIIYKLWKNKKSLDS